ncbi:MAG: hydrogenase nickel incorporation protein HypB [bacterium]
MPIKIQVLNDILEFNESFATENRRVFDRNKTFAVNLMSSPGAGKTTLLERTLERLAPASVAVIEGDMRTTRDAERLERFGIQIVQINTGNACHLDGQMVHNALQELDLGGVRLLLIENVGNLVCPAEFRMGEHAKVAVLSVTEGEDKPLKYPLMFRESSLCVFNKTDLLPHLDYRLEEAIQNARQINPKLEHLAMSCKTGEGLDRWISWLQAGIDRMA